MITIVIYGIDPYISKQISRESTSQIAKLYEVNEEEIRFFGTEGLLSYKGEEQNLWNIYIVVNAPIGTEKVEKPMFELMKKYTQNVAFHFTLEFHYFKQISQYQYVNDQFDRFFDESKATIKYSYDSDEEDTEEEDSDDDIYLGNAFEGVLPDDDNNSSNSTGGIES